MICFATITATTAVHQIVNGVLVGTAIFGAVKYKKIPTVKVK